MTLENFFKTLPRLKQINIAYSLLKSALPIWSEFAENNKLEYKDSVVGLKHTVNKDIIKNVLSLAEKISEANQYVYDKETITFKKTFTEPIVALQDGDWELPDAVLLTFYSAYNLMTALTEPEENTFHEPSIYISVNNAIEALEITQKLSSEEIKRILYS